MNILLLVLVFITIAAVFADEVDGDKMKTVKEGDDKEKTPEDGQEKTPSLDTKAKAKKEKKIKNKTNKNKSYINEAKKNEQNLGKDMVKYAQQEEKINLKLARYAAVRVQYQKLLNADGDDLAAKGINLGNRFGFYNNKNVDDAIKKGEPIPAVPVGADGELIVGEPQEANPKQVGKLQDSNANFLKKAAKNTVKIAKKIEKLDQKIKKLQQKLSFITAARANLRKFASADPMKAAEDNVNFQKAFSHLTGKALKQALNKGAGSSSVSTIEVDAEGNPLPPSDSDSPSTEDDDEETTEDDDAETTPSTPSTEDDDDKETTPSTPSVEGEDDDEDDQ